MALCHVYGKMLDNHFINGKTRFFQDAVKVVAVAEKHEFKIVVRYSQKIEFVCARGKISYAARQLSSMVKDTTARCSLKE